MTDRQRSGQVLRSEPKPHAAGAAGPDRAPLWIIALPSFACTVALGGYLLVTIADRVI